MKFQNSEMNGFRYEELQRYDHAEFNRYDYLEKVGNGVRRVESKDIELRLLGWTTKHGRDMWENGMKDL